MYYYTTFDIHKYTRLGKLLSNSRIYAVINDLVKSPMLNKVLEFISMLTGSKTTRILLLLLKFLAISNIFLSTGILWYNDYAPPEIISIMGGYIDILKLKLHDVYQNWLKW